MGAAAVASETDQGRAVPRARRGNIGATSRRQENEIVVIGGAPPYDRGQWLRSRILGLVEAGERWHDGWRYEPGCVPWHAIRTAVGGRVHLPEFRAAVDDLLAAGKLLEVWTRTVGRRTPGHVLLRPRHSAALRQLVQQARGRRDVILNEPWGPALLANRP